MVLHPKLLAQPQLTLDEKRRRKNSVQPGAAVAAASVVVVVVVVAVVDGGEPLVVLLRDAHVPHLKVYDFAVVVGESPFLANRHL
jgi:hypothetical protein